jgi:hypothetical protein
VKTLKKRCKRKQDNDTKVKTESERVGTDEKSEVKSESKDLPKKVLEMSTKLVSQEDLICMYVCLWQKEW